MRPAAKPSPAAPPAVADRSVAELTAGSADGSLSPVDAAEAAEAAALDRIAQFDGTVNAFVHVDEATTMAMTRASAARWRAGTPLGPIDGVPTAVKDLKPIAGWPLRRGSLALPADVPAPPTPRPWRGCARLVPSSSARPRHPNPARAS